MECPYCGRKFNENAAERHIPYCKTKSKETAIRGGGTKTIGRGGTLRR